MTPIELESKLTPAARQALDELVAEYREQVLDSAAQVATGPSGELREIGVRDIISSARRGRRDLRRLRPEDLLLWYLLALGFSAFAWGLFTFALGDWYDRLDFERRTALGVAIFGAAATLVVAFFLRIRRKPTLEAAPVSDLVQPSGRSRPDLIALFLRRWLEVELALRSLAATHMGESSAAVPLSVLIERLRETEALGATQERVLRSVLTTRNKVVHGRQGTSDDELVEALSQIEALLSGLPLAAT